jgi:glycosyltransferase involved in cell wall biosynthesis
VEKKEKECPHVSVVMAVYNAEKYLKLAIDSILNQTFRDFEDGFTI